MIEKKRLEELIEQGATVYVSNEHRVEQIKLVDRVMGVSVDEYNKIHDCEPMLYSQFCGVVRDICPISWVFETKEEAEWHKEFGCIERTERLELPTWEEFKAVSFNDKYGKNICLEKAYGNIYLQKCNEFYVEVLYFKEKATKENYTLACRKAKELFLGEKK